LPFDNAMTVDTPGKHLPKTVEIFEGGMPTLLRHGSAPLAVSEAPPERSERGFSLGAPQQLHQPLYLVWSSRT